MRTSRIFFARGLVFLFLSTGVVRGATWVTKRLTSAPGDSVSPAVAASGAAVYIVWQDDKPGNDEIYFRRSGDYGVTWRGALRLTDNAGSSKSPAVAADGSIVYVVWQDSSAGLSQIFFRKSEDGGARWGAAKALTGNKTALAGGPALAIAGSELYVVWHNESGARGGKNEIAFKKSSDRGAHWQAARTLSDASSWTEARNPAVAAFGSSVFVAWESLVSGNREIQFRKSTDAGAGWQAVRKLTANAGASSSPALAVRGSAVFLAWEDATPGNPEIYFRKSPDNGATWKPEERLSVNAGQSRAPALAVNGESVYVAWEDDTPGNPEAYLGKSTNGGTHWPALERLTKNSGASRGLALAAGGSKLYVTWSDRTPGNPEIYVMHKTPGPNGISIVSPTASSTWTKGETADIRWLITEGAAGGTRENLLGVDKVKIDLYRGGDLRMPVVAKTDAGSGRYPWTVPESLEDGKDYRIRIASAADGRIFKDSPSFEIGSVSLPDLVVQSLTHDPVNPTTSSQVTITAVIKNQGSGPAGASLLSWGESGSITSRDIPALASGATATVSRTLGTLSPGAHVLRAMADDDCTIVESIEDNNAMTDTFTVTAPLPDLIVNDVWNSPEMPTELDSITIFVEVKNIGPVPAGSSTLKVGTATFATPALAAGAVWTWSQTIGPLSIGGHGIYATADVNGEVAESNETNNIRNSGFTVRGVPDLVVTSLTHSPANPKTTDIVTITAVVYNEGWDTGVASTLSLRVGGEATPATYSIPALAYRRETATITRTVGPFSAGTYQVTATADCQGVMLESDETNNVTIDSFTVTAALPDLVVSSLTGSISATGGSFTAVVRNDGSGAAGASVLRMMLKMGTTNIASMDFNIPALSSGATRSQSHSVTMAIPPGTYTLTAYGDATGLVTESNEGNNNRSLTLSR